MNNTKMDIPFIKTLMIILSILTCKVQGVIKGSLTNDLKTINSVSTLKFDLE